MLTAVAEPGDGGSKTCFVAMPVTTPATYADDLHDADHFGHVLEHLFKPALEQAGYMVIPPKMLGAALIHAEIIRHLEQADLVFADLSGHNPNVFFELGIRTALDRPVVLVKDARTAMIPFDLGTINVLTYDESLAAWTLNEEIKRLAGHISDVPTDNASGNAMWRYFGLTKRGGPAEVGSLEEKIDLVLAEMAKLRLAPMAPNLIPAISQGRVASIVLGDLLTALRQRKSATLSEIADAIGAGVSRRTINEYLSGGRVPPSKELLLALLRALGATEEERVFAIAWWTDHLEGITSY
jgi:hypothetical protein